MKPAINVLWFKRDLRLQDHEPLRRALASGQPLLLLYCFEPSLLAAPQSEARHWGFVGQSIQDLNRQLQALGGKVEVFHQEMLPLLKTLAQKYEIQGLYSHEETGLGITYARDKQVQAFCRQQGIRWEESRSGGVMRGLRHRLNWVQNWSDTMLAPQVQADWQGVRFVSGEGEISGLPSFGPENPARFQAGGESRAHLVLQEFLQTRAKDYHRHLSKPLHSRSSCSRLSAHLAWGNLSVRQAYQATQQRLSQKGFRRPLQNFAMRLRWHCHFIQKFESEERMEFENVNQGYDRLSKEVNPAAFEAWKSGHTGYPLVDACMRCVIETGYLNFRMRAMLVSFLTHHLLQDWKAGAFHLARQFLDFEPGIHYPQFQMQAGMTGTNTVRIYNPIKQAQDHDPEGYFIRQWIPELRDLPTYAVHEPWNLTEMEQQMYGFRPGRDYPRPIVDLAKSGPRARDLLWHMRRHSLVQQEKQRILFQHSLPNRPRQK